MARALFFNISGPCVVGKPYMLAPERRLSRVLTLIEQEKYFTIHAGRQTGKTTSLMWLERPLCAAGDKRPEKLFLREALHLGKTIRIVGC